MASVLYRNAKVGNAVLFTSSQVTAQPPAASTVTSVTVSPDDVALVGGGTQQYTAVVNGTNGPSQAGTWSTSLGSISASGLLTAPAGTSSVQPGSVTFTSTQDPTKSDNAPFSVLAIGTQLVLTYRFISLQRDYNTDTIHFSD